MKQPALTCRGKMRILWQSVSERGCVVLATEGMKICRACHLEKPVTEFSVTDRARGYRKARCKTCESARVRLYYANNNSYREKTKARSKKWDAFNPSDRKLASRRSMLKSKYGITEEQYKELLLAQNGKCALCGSENHGRTGNSGRHDGSRNWKSDNWPVDHDHVTGRVRGLLCHKCNVRIGAYEALLNEIGIDVVSDYLSRPCPVPELLPVSLPQYRYFDELPSHRVSDCLVDGCNRRARKRGMCEMHYERQRRGNEVGGADKISLRGAQALVGTAHPKARLTEDDVRAIRASNATGVALAECYGVTTTLISNVRRGKTWKHIA